MEKHFPCQLFFTCRSAREGRKTRVATRTKDSHFSAETIANILGGVTDASGFNQKEAVRLDAEAPVKSP